MSDPRPPEPAALPDPVEDALADALLRSPAARERKLRALFEAYPEFGATLRQRIAELTGTSERVRSGAVEQATTAAAAVDEIGVGARIDRYELLRLIAEGGMGAVWLAEQREPMQRRVAIKVIKLGLDTCQVMARFEAERQALALMDHPMIAKVLDAGSTASGRPYFVMEYIEGIPILEHCDRAELDIEARLRLFLDVCRAIQHAHQKGVIHRDIKPSNVLVTMHDGVPVPKVIDFGIAKAMAGDLTERTLLTEYRQLVGTPAYMAPEQAEMSGLDVDTRSDVYSLGVLLYELLTGTTPFDNDDLLTRGCVEMVRTIREVEPPRPSARVADPRLRGDLDWIVMRCLEKDRSRRYETANDLLADIRRHLADEPVSAGPPSAAYRVHKFVRRNRGRVVAAAAVATALVLGLVASGLGWRWALEEKENAEVARIEEARARTEAEQLVEFLRRTLEGIGPSVARGRDTTMLEEMMSRAVARIETGELAFAPQAEIRLRGTIGVIYTQLALFEPAEAMLRGALELARSIHAGDRPELADAMGRLAGLYYQVGRLPEAEALYRDSLAILRRVVQGDDRRLSFCLGSLAMTLQARGDLDGAEPLYRESLAMNERLYGGDHEYVAWSMQCLATLLSARGADDEAESYYHDVLAMHRRLFPGDSPQVATSLGHLAILLHRRGQLQPAEVHYRESLAMNRRLFPDDHPNAATGLTALAMLLRDVGRLDEAIELALESQAMSRRLFADDHPSRLADLDLLAGLYRAQGRHELAIPLLEEAVAVHEAGLGRRHVETMSTLVGLGDAYLAVGRGDEAMTLFDEAAAAVLEEPELSDVGATLRAVLSAGRERLGPATAERLAALERDLRAAEVTGTGAVR